MGSHSPAVPVKDAQGHGVRVLPVNVNESDRRCTVGDMPDVSAGSAHRPASCVRLGLTYVGDLRAEAAATIVEERSRGDRSRSASSPGACGCRKTSSTCWRTEIGAFDSLGEGIHWREALWQVEGPWRPKGPLFEGQDDAPPAPGPLAPMLPFERLEADYRRTGLTDGGQASHALLARADGGHGRAVLPRGGGCCRRAARAGCRGGGHAPAPGTAKGFCFIALEDETGVSHLILSPQVFQAHRLVVALEAFLLAQGTLQNTDGTAAVKTEVLEALKPPALGIESNDFHWVPLGDSQQRPRQRAGTSRSHRTLSRATCELHHPVRARMPASQPCALEASKCLSWGESSSA